MRTRPPWWISHQATRRPVSRSRQVAGIVVAVVILLTYMGWRYVTNAERLRVYAEMWLEEFSGGEAHVERVEFNLFRGMNLIGVTLAVPESAQFNPHDNSLEARTLFRCPSVFLQLRPLSVISGHLAVPEIAAVHPELFLIHRSADGVGNWQRMFGNRPRAGREPWRTMPTIRLRDARVAQLRLGEDGAMQGGPQTFWADAIPLAGKGDLYRLEVTKFMDEVQDDQVTGEFGYLEINLQTLAISARVPWISVEDLYFTAPIDVQRWLELLGVHGYVSSDYLRYEPGKGGRVHLILRDAGISIPVDEEDRARMTHERYLSFENVNGTLMFENHQAHIGLKGRFHGGLVELTGTLSLPEGESLSFEEMGFDLQVVAEGITFPRAEVADDPSQARFVERWKHFRNFMEDFDPRGQATLNVRVNKHPGPQHGIEFVEGTLRLDDCSAAYIHFPYRFDHFSGTVHWRPDRKVEIRDLRGRRGQATVHVEGLHQGYHTQGFEVTVRASNVPLDAYLLSHLSEADQDLVKRFNAEAQTDIDLRLHRDALPAGSPDNPARREIDVTFLDGKMWLDVFNYPLEQLAGRLLIRGDTYEFEHFSGRQGSARVELNGRAVREEARDVRFELKLDATDVALDEVLAEALPERVRQAYQELTPSGMAEISGLVKSGGMSEPLDYDLTARLRDIELHVAEPRMHLVDASAEVKLLPQRVDVPEFTCRLGPSQLKANGTLAYDTETPRFQLDVASQRLQLDENVYQALPGAVRAVWDDFAPQGAVRLDMKLANRPATTRPAGAAGEGEAELPLDRVDPLTPTTRPGVESRWPYDFQVSIEPINAQITYARFPLPLAHVTGRIEANPEQVNLINVKARHEDSTIELGGKVYPHEGGLRSELTIQAEDLTFSEPLRLAVPWRTRRLWNDVKPRGRFDLHLDKVLIESDEEASTEVEMAGKALLHNVEMGLGVQVSQADGEVSGRIAWGDVSTMDLKLALEKAVVEGRTMKNVTARLVERPAQNKMYLRNLQADFYEGKLTGVVEVTRQDEGSRYGVTLNIQDVSLAGFVNARRGEGEPLSEMNGVLSGNLSMTGRFGRPRSRRGGGSLVLNRAELFKVPLMLAILQVIHFAIDDSNAIHDATTTFVFDGEDLILQQIDMRGRALSMVGAGRVHTPSQQLDVVLLVGSPLQLPRVEILTELMEGVARELMEVHLEGSVNDPKIRADIVRSVRATLETILNLRRPSTSSPK